MIFQASQGPESTFPTDPGEALPKMPGSLALRRGVSDSLRRRAAMMIGFARGVWRRQLRLHQGLFEAKRPESVRSIEKRMNARKASFM